MLGDVYCRFLVMSCLPLLPVIGGTTMPPIRTGPLSRGGLTTTSTSRVVVPFLHVLFTCPGVCIMRALMRTASLITLFVVGVMISWGVPENLSVIRGSFIVVVIGRVRLLNNLCCKFPFLVSLTFLFFPSLVWLAAFGLLAGSPFALFSSDSYYPASLTVNTLNVSASASELFSLSLVKIGLSLSPCVLGMTGVWQKVPTVTLLGSASSSAITWSIACLIFSLENGASLRSLYSTRVSYIFVYNFSLGVSMHDRSYSVSRLFKILFPHSNMLKYLVSLITGSYITEGSSYPDSFLASFLFVFLWTYSDSLSSVELSYTIMLFDSSSPVELTWDKVSSFFLICRTNVGVRNLIHTSRFRSYSVNVKVEGISSHHTIHKPSF